MFGKHNFQFLQFYFVKFCKILIYTAIAYTYIVSASFDLGVQSMLIFIPERWVSNQQYVKYHTWRKNLKLLIELNRIILFELLY